MKRLLCACTLGLLLTPVAATSRQWQVSKLKKLSLEEILNLEVSTGTKTALSLSDVPASVTVFTREELRSMGVRTLQDVVNLVPGFTFGRSNQITANEGAIYVRGTFSLFGEGVLVLRDGQRLNDPSSGGGFVFTADYPIEAFKQIEFVRGPGSALYGANAFVGVINLVSDASRIEDRTEIMVRAGTLDSVYSSLHYGKRFGEHLKLAVDAHFNRYDLGDLDLGTITQRVPTPFGVFETTWEDRVAHETGETAAISATLAYRDWRFVADHKALDNENALGIGLPRSGTFVDILGGVHEGLNSSRFNTGSDTDSSSLALFHDHDYSSALSSHFTLSHADYASSFRVFLLSYLHLSTPHVGETVEGDTNTVVSSTSTTSFDGYFNYSPSERHSFVAGVNLQRDRGRERTVATAVEGPVVSVLFDEPVSTVSIPETERDVVALYGEYIWSPIKQLSVTAGLRGDDYSDFGSSVNPRLAVIYRPVDGFVLKALLGSAFRAPTFQEAHRRLGAVLLPNPNLQPEELDSYELQGTWLVGDELSLGLTGYTVEIDNVIRQVSTRNPAEPRQQAFLNLGNREAEGVEAELRWAPSAIFSVYLTYDHVFQSIDRVNGVEKDVEGVPHSGLNLAVNLDLGKGVELNLTGHRRWDWVDQAPLQIAGVNVFDGVDLKDYTILNLKVSKRLASRSLELFGQVNNVLDEERRFAESLAFQPAGIPTGARQALIGVRLLR